MAKRRPAAVLEFMQWLKNTAADPRFGSSFRGYDAVGRRTLCRQSIQGQNAWRVGGNRTRRRRRTSRAFSASGTAGKCPASRDDYNSRCGRDVDDAGSAVTHTSLQGPLNERTWKPRKIPPPNAGSEKHVEEACQRLTGILSISHPEDEVHHFLRGWRQDGVSRARTPERNPHDVFHQWGESESREGCDGNDEGGWAYCRSRARLAPLKPALWEQEFVVQHPPVLPGFVLRVEVGSVGGPRTLEQNSGRKREDGDETDGLSFGQTGSARGKKNTASSVVKVFLTPVGDPGGSDCHKADNWSTVFPEDARDSMKIAGKIVRAGDRRAGKQQRSGSVGRAVRAVGLDFSPPASTSADAARDSKCHRGEETRRIIGGGMGNKKSREQEGDVIDRPIIQSKGARGQLRPLRRPSPPLRKRRSGPQDRTPVLPRTRVLHPQSTY